MKANRIRRARWRILFGRWWRGLFEHGEHMTKMQQAGTAVFDNTVKDVDNTRLDFCPATNKRFVTRGSDVIIIHNLCIVFSGRGYYYSIQYPQGAYCDITERFDDELSKRLNCKHRRVLDDVNTQIRGILADAQVKSR